MSHVKQVDLRITSLDALEAACCDLGLVLRRDQRTFAWYGEFVGDTVPDPRYPPEIWGTCQHAIAFVTPQLDPVTGLADYEVGLVARADGTEGYELLLDSWGPGQRWLRELGPGLDRLRDRYGFHVAKAELEADGFTCSEQRNAQGELQLVAEKF